MTRPRRGARWAGALGALGTLGALMVATPAVAAAQDFRASWIERAGSSSAPAAMDLLFRAAEPAAAVVDAVAARAAEGLALRLLGAGDRVAAVAFRTWAARHRGGRPAGDTGGEFSTTTWRWPPAFSPRAEGEIRVHSLDPDVAVTVALQGAARTTRAGSDEAVRLPAGTYAVVITAPGREELRLEREVLPGVTTLVDVDLPPALPGAILPAAARHLVRVSWATGASGACVTGVMTARGLVLAPLGALQQLTGLQVVTAAGDTLRDVRSMDADTVLAVLGPVEEPRGVEFPAADSAASPAMGGHAWAAWTTDCGPAPPRAGRLRSWSVSSASARFAPGLGADARGAALFDASGELLGVVVHPGDDGGATVVPLAATGDLVAGALRQWDRGPPWRWIVPAGVVAVGAIVYALRSGGPDSGSIVISIPGG